MPTARLMSTSGPREGGHGQNVQANQFGRKYKHLIHICSWKHLLPSHNIDETEQGGEWARSGNAGWQISNSCGWAAYILTFWNCSCKRSSAPSISIIRLSNNKSCKRTTKRKKRKLKNKMQTFLLLFVVGLRYGNHIEANPKSYIDDLAVQLRVKVPGVCVCVNGFVCVCMDRWPMKPMRRMRNIFLYISICICRRVCVCVCV